MVTKLKRLFTLKGCLFGAVKITESVDPDKHSYSNLIIAFLLDLIIVCFFHFQILIGLKKSLFFE